nr:hypothetical protein [Xanthomonas oryzae]
MKLGDQPKSLGIPFKLQKVLLLRLSQFLYKAIVSGKPVLDCCLALMAEWRIAKIMNKTNSRT